MWALMATTLSAGALRALAIDVARSCAPATSRSAAGTCSLSTLARPIRHALKCSGHPAGAVPAWEGRSAAVLCGRGTVLAAKPPNGLHARRIHAAAPRDAAALRREAICRIGPGRNALPALKPRQLCQQTPRGADLSGAAERLRSAARSARRLMPALPDNAVTRAVAARWRATFGQSVFSFPSAGDVKKAMMLQLMGIWQKNRYLIIGGTAVTAVYYLWRTTYGIASVFIDLSETFAEAGFLAFSIAMAVSVYLFARHRLTIYPSKLYRMAMGRLNTSPTILQAMGAPITGSHLQASVLSGGGLRIKGMGECAVCPSLPNPYAPPPSYPPSYPSSFRPLRIRDPHPSLTKDGWKSESFPILIILPYNCAHDCGYVWIHLRGLPLPSPASDVVACATVLVSVVTAVSVVNVGMWVNVMRVGFKIRSRRLHMIFPISGPEARGVVSIEAKKRKGRHEFKLLAVDIVGLSDGAEQRVFLEGDDARYDRGGILSELRDPFLKVTAAETMYEREDDEEELQIGLDKKRIHETSRNVYFYEWAWDYVRDAAAGVTKRIATSIRAKAGARAGAGAGVGTGAGSAKGVQKF